MTRPTMTIDGAPVPMGEMVLHFHHYPDESPPDTMIDLQSDPQDATLGGVALNCLHLEGIAKVGELAGRQLRFGGDDDGSSEIGESVFWRPGDRTLEIERLDVRFGDMDGGSIAVELHASCFTLFGLSKFAVAVVGHARLAGAPPDRKAWEA